MKNLAQIVGFVGCCAFAAMAAEGFLTKPFTEWADKDVVRLLQNSPWAHPVSVSFGAPAQSTESDGARGASGTPNMNGPNSGRRGGRGGESMESLSTGASVLLTVRWHSALPVRQATVLLKLGRDKVSSDEATRFLTQAMPGYVIVLAGLPENMGRMPPERLSELAKTATALRIKDKGPIPAASAERVNREHSVDLYFVFPKTSPIDLDDKEVEFVANLGRIEVKRKFKLKDMMVGDKLEL